MIDYDKYEKSLKHLELQFANFQEIAGRPDLNTLDREAVKESVIQRFEVSYDCLWKTLKRYLVEELGVPEMPNSPKPVFRIAFENKLITNIEQWLKYADERTGTSHDYSSGKAGDVLQSAGLYVRDAVALYKTMSGQTWQ